MELRDYQKKAIGDIYQTWIDSRSVLLQMPTGTGKTNVFCQIAIDSLNKYPDKKVLIIVHRRELIFQAKERLLQFDKSLKIGIIASTYIENSNFRIQVASIQTLIRRTNENTYSTVIIDEAHHSKAKTYTRLWTMFPNAYFLGVTATPIRTNGEGFNDLFDKLITSQTIKEFIYENTLSDIKYFATHTPDISEVKIKNTGDYDNTELSLLMQDKSIMADLIKSYKDIAFNKKGIVFAVNINHSKEIEKRYNKEGIKAKHIDASTKKIERERIINEFKENKFQILCNVNIFTEGFDCPDIDFVQLARPTKSLTLFLQQVGRCMRPAIGKDFAIVLDNAGLWKEHGLPKIDREWTLKGIYVNNEMKKIKGKIPHKNSNNKLPNESTQIELIEVENIEDANLSEIEKLIINKKIKTMENRIIEITENIQNLTSDFHTVSSKIAKDAIAKELKSKNQELKEMKTKLLITRLKNAYNQIIEDYEYFEENERNEFKGQFSKTLLHENNSQTQISSPISSSSLKIEKNCFIRRNINKYTIEIKFKSDNQQGVLIGCQNKENEPTRYNPIIYIGTDSKLYSGYWSDNKNGMAQIISKYSVDDNVEHTVQLKVNFDNEPHQECILDDNIIGSNNWKPIKPRDNYCQLKIGYTKDWIQTKDDWFKFDGEIISAKIYNEDKIFYSYKNGV